MEIKSKLTVTRWEGIMEEKGERVFRNNYKGHMDKTKRVVESEEGGGDGWGGGKNADNCT